MSVQIETVAIDRKVTSELLDVIKRHGLNVGMAMGHLLQLAAAIGKANPATGTGLDLFVKNAKAAWQASPKDLLKGD